MPLPKAGNPPSTLKWCSLQFRISILPTVCFAADVFFLIGGMGCGLQPPTEKKSHYGSRVLKTKLNKGKRREGGKGGTTDNSLIPPVQDNDWQYDHDSKEEHLKTGSAPCQRHPQQVAADGNTDASYI